MRAVLPLIGAGVYEEFLFRLTAVGLIAWALRVLGVGGLTGWCVAAVVSSWFFAAAHHWGPMGQVYSPLVFSFRMAAGIVLCILARFRGFSIAVGTHLLYNLIVGLRPVAGLP
jgi:membrane protease YdiL (CAAX protease family)